MIRLLLFALVVLAAVFVVAWIVTPTPHGPSNAGTALPTPAHAHRHRKPARGTHAAPTATSSPVPVGGKCKLRGTGDMTAPVARCTPGAVDPSLPLTVAQVCQHRDRAPISETERHAIEAEYGFAPGTFHGELDHRVPHFLNGADTPANLWPEPGSIPNLKDQLENAVRAMVCAVPSAMTPADAVRLFERDWRPAFRKYVPGG